MSTDIKKKTVSIVPTSTEQAGPIDVFASGGNFENAQRVAKALSLSSLVPEAYRGNIPNVLIAMELAGRIKASVFSVMQHLDIIHGRPSWRATFLIATVNACGRFTPLRFRWVGTEGKDDWGCYAVAKDRESGDECIGPTVTMTMVKSEGWLSKNGSKWKTMPTLMFHYRSAAFWTRVYAPELSLGMHTGDELDDAYGSSRVIQDAEIVSTSGPTVEAVKAALEQAEAMTEQPIDLDAPVDEVKQ